MTDTDNEKIREQLRVYDEECARGIVHDDAYNNKMLRYRIALTGSSTA